MEHFLQTQQAVMQAAFGRQAVQPQIAPSAPQAQPVMPTPAPQPAAPFREVATEPKTELKVNKIVQPVPRSILADVLVEAPVWKQRRFSAESRKKLFSAGNISAEDKPSARIIATISPSKYGTETAPPLSKTASNSLSVIVNQR